ncbi:siphovirus ReqiPepy6 Gp37-like family protein [Galactobacillus timonensis]|uniref:siphovirus ReqiPepy6 Gp37-like family protein n=1 Tax=Galactobacillus timonensis TaxID=2041840 RepID=UPI0014366E5D|nr:siphovirus ReqiPepy6 Gp37-like family protein [Galactobacillus timonensis]
MDFAGIVDNFSSLQWNRKYSEPGSFELHCPITEANTALLRRGSLVWKKGAKEAGVIEDLKLEETAKKAEITAKGRFLSSYMDRRLIRPFYACYGKKAELAIREIYSNAAAIPQVELGPLNGYTETVTFQATYQSLLAKVEEICAGMATGFRFRPDFVNKKIYFEFYRGLDHSITQSDRERVIFSDGFANLDSATYEENEQIYKNVCYVGGQGEGSDRTIVEVGATDSTGLERRESFLSATDVQSDKITADQYKDALKQRGNVALSNSILASSFDASVNPDGNFKYLVDYDLGDIVTVQKEAYGITQNLRITEISEVYENGIYKIEPKFGEGLTVKNLLGTMTSTGGGGVSVGGSKHASEVIAVSTSDAHTSETINGVGYQKYSKTMANAYQWDTVDVSAYPTGSSQVPTNTELANFQLIKFYGVDDAGGKTINFYCTKAVSSDFAILVTGVAYG